MTFEGFEDILAAAAQTKEPVPPSNTEIRRSVLSLLRQRPMSIADLAWDLQMPDARITEIVDVLREKGMVTGDKKLKLGDVMQRAVKMLNW